jgi:tetratricopeptide repeat protein
VLAIDPTEQDANVALGMSNYVIGCLPSYKRAFLWFGGLHGDRNRGMEQMQSAAEHGHYLQPFAKVMLALAYEREHKPERAKELLADLATQFPDNPVFARELAIVTSPSCCKN